MLAVCEDQFFARLQPVNKDTNVLKSDISCLITGEKQCIAPYQDFFHECICMHDNIYSVYELVVQT